MNKHCSEGSRSMYTRRRLELRMEIQDNIGGYIGQLRDLASAGMWGSRAVREIARGKQLSVLGLLERGEQP